MRLGEYTDYDYRFASCDCDVGTDELFDQRADK
jgi:hypothetical protein